ncbi:hypothetical protein ABW19_dt0207147 [Dactylella cylindrospora]|nr:hypothetical protein ABW19_dt0207147 [Dactylella cylindrospora]
MVNALSITFPLYIYPAGCANQPYSAGCAWYPFFQSVAAYPSLVFNFIVNVDSGPGPSNYPDSNWISAINWVNSQNNTRTLGYIDSNPTSIPRSTYISWMIKYSNWRSYPDTTINLGMDGIFVDDVTYYPSSANYYQTYVNDAKSTLGQPSPPFIMLNPGTPINCSFYPQVNSVVSFEDFYTNLPNAPFTQSAYSACPRYKQTAIIHDFTGTALDQQQVCDDLGQTQRIGSLFITSAVQTSNQNPYDDVPPLLQQFVGSVKATNSWIIDHPQWYPDI